MASSPERPKSRHISPQNAKLSRRVLAVDDNAADRVLVQTAFSTLDAGVSITCVRSGAEALQYLKKAPPFEKAERPQLILLDLKLPGMSGKEVLAEIKSDQDLKTIPVLILSHSTDAGDIAESYELQASCYLQKPLGFGEFLRLIHAVNQFWIQRVTYSPPSGPS